MGAKPYPAYRDSGVEWIGEIPEHWEVKRLKDVADCRLSNVDKHTVDGEAAVVLCNYVDVYKNDFITSDISFMSATATPNQISKLSINVDDVLITKDSESPDDIGVPALVRSVVSSLVCGYHLALIRTESHTQDGGYTFRFLTSKSATSQFYTMAKGITRYAIGKGEISRLLLPSPPLEEQKLIASFLDRETSKIDTLIEKQQQLINLLKEKRGSLISHTVTKGLNPNAPMKDSGVEWIGEIPEHWEVGKIGNVSRLLSTSESNGDYTVALENIEPWTGNYLYTDSEYASSGTPFEQGDVLFGKLRPYLAKVYLANSSGLAIGDLFTLRTTSTQAPEFFALWLRCREFIDIVDGMTYGAKMPRVSFSQFKVLPIPSPPLEEQNQIESFLDAETSKIDTLIEKANQSIALLKERRSSLISAAVTGKIDVREAA